MEAWRGGRWRRPEAGVRGPEQRTQGPPGRPRVTPGAARAAGEAARRAGRAAAKGRTAPGAPVADTRSAAAASARNPEVGEQPGWLPGTLPARVPAPPRLPPAPVPPPFGGISSRSRKQPPPPCAGGIWAKGSWGLHRPQHPSDTRCPKLRAAPLTLWASCLCDSTHHASQVPCASPGPAEKSKGLDGRQLAGSGGPPGGHAGQGPRGWAMGGGVPG